MRRSPSCQGPRDPFDDVTCRSRAGAFIDPRRGVGRASGSARGRFRGVVDDAGVRPSVDTRRDGDGATDVASFVPGRARSGPRADVVRGGGDAPRARVVAFFDPFGLPITCLLSESLVGDRMECALGIPQTEISLITWHAGQDSNPGVSRIVR